MKGEKGEVERDGMINKGRGGVEGKEELYRGKRLKRGRGITIFVKIFTIS